MFIIRIVSVAFLVKSIFHQVYCSPGDIIINGEIKQLYVYMDPWSNLSFVEPKKNTNGFESPSLSTHPRPVPFTSTADTPVDYYIPTTTSTPITETTTTGANEFVPDHIESSFVLGVPVNSSLVETLSDSDESQKLISVPGCPLYEKKFKI